MITGQASARAGLLVENFGRPRMRIKSRRAPGLGKEALHKYRAGILSALWLCYCEETCLVSRSIKCTQGSRNEAVLAERDSPNAKSLAGMPMR